MRSPIRLALLAAAVALPIEHRAVEPRAAPVLVACAPGYPGTTAEAQPNMDALAAAMSEAAGWPKGELSAVYFETEKAGLERLEKPGAALAMVPLPFFLEHGQALKLTPRLAPVQKGGEASEVWSLVAKKGRVTGPASLEGWQLVSLAGFSPRFVRAALSGWGKLPAGVQVVMSGQVLSGLRKAVAGENVALLLDRAQAAALPTLPFAGELEVVARSPAWPGSLLCTVDKRLPAARWSALGAALPGLAKRPEGAAALEGVRLAGFAPVDEAGLGAARRAFAQAAGR